jgi:hypothetical protein
MLEEIQLMLLAADAVAAGGVTFWETTTLVFDEQPLDGSDTVKL